MPKRTNKNESREIKKEIDILKERLNELNLEEIKGKAKERKDEIEEFVRKKPLLSLAIAVGAGILLGKLLRD